MEQMSTNLTTKLKELGGRMPSGAVATIASQLVRDVHRVASCVVVPQCWGSAAVWGFQCAAETEVGLCERYPRAP